MGNNYFKFKQFTISQTSDVFRVGTDGVLLGAWVRTDGVRSLLDIGTGTGLIALMLSYRVPEAMIFALEPDENSFNCARANIERAGKDEVITLHKTALNDFLPPAQTLFDLIISNPPFFAESLENPDPQKARFRHNFALPSSEILNFAVKYLTANGRLVLVLPYAEGNVFVAEAASSGLYCTRMTKVRSLYESGPNRLLLEFSRHRKPVSVKILTIGHPDHGGYTAEYKEITRDFYLNF